jgi:uncharacterized protein YqgC (DUF456 family)
MVAYTDQQGFDTNASKVAVIVLAVLWILTLWWAQKSWVAWVTIALVAVLIIVSDPLAAVCPRPVFHPVWRQPVQNGP